MPACSICAHKERRAIDEALAARRPHRAIAADFNGVSKTAVGRHAKHVARTPATTHGPSNARGASGACPAGRTGAEAIAASERESLLVRLRIEGQSYRAIEAATGIPASTAFGVVSAAMQRSAVETAETIDAARAIELARLDELQAGLWPRATAPQRGQDAAVERITKLSERRAKLLGLDAPEAKNVRHSGAVGVMAGTPTEIAALYQRLEAGDEEAATALHRYSLVGALPGVAFDVQAFLAELLEAIPELAPWLVRAPAPYALSEPDPASIAGNGTSGIGTT